MHKKVQLTLDENRKSNTILFGVKIYKGLKAAKITTKLYTGFSGYYRADVVTSFVMSDAELCFKKEQDHKLDLK